jgi:hypothetical protein
MTFFPDGTATKIRGYVPAIPHLWMQLVQISALEISFYQCMRYKNR